MKLNKKILIIAAVLATVVTIGIYYYMNLSQETSAKSSLTEVCVAKENIPAKMKIESSMVDIAQIDNKYLLKNAVTLKGDAVGKYSVERIVQGEQIVSDRIVSLDKSGLSYQVPKGKRAVTIEVDELSGVVHMIKPGDYLDVLVYHEEEQIEDKNAITVYPDIAKIVLQKVLVLAIDKNYSSTVENIATTEKTETEDNLKKLTLALSPGDSEKLILGDHIGKIHLALRNPEDENIADTPGAVKTDILPERGKKVLQK